MHLERGGEGWCSLRAVVVYFSQCFWKTSQSTGSMNYTKDQIHPLTLHTKKLCVVSWISVDFWQSLLESTVQLPLLLPALLSLRGAEQILHADLQWKRILSDVGFRYYNYSNILIFRYIWQTLNFIFPIFRSKSLGCSKSMTFWTLSGVFSGLLPPILTGSIDGRAASPFWPSGSGEAENQDNANRRFLLPFQLSVLACLFLKGRFWMQQRRQKTFPLDASSFPPASAMTPGNFFLYFAHSY